MLKPSAIAALSVVGAVASNVGAYVLSQVLGSIPEWIVVSVFVGLVILWLVIYLLWARRASDATETRNDLRAHNKRLVEESFARMEFVPQTHDSRQELVSTEFDDKYSLQRKHLPYLEQVMSHLRSYSALQSLLDHLPTKYRTTESERVDAFDIIETGIRIQLEGCISMPMLRVISGQVAQKVMMDIIDHLSDSPLVSVGYTSDVVNGRRRVAGVVEIGDDKDTVQCVPGLLKKMDALARDIKLKAQYSSIKKSSSEVGEGKEKFAEGIRVIVEKATLSQFDTLEGDCSECKDLKRRLGIKVLTEAIR